jgi:hypothetical protein
VAIVLQKDVPVYQEWVGTMAGNIDADIRPKVDGFLLNKLYNEGSFVKKGPPMFRCSSWIGASRNLQWNRRRAILSRPMQTCRRRRLMSTAIPRWSRRRRSARPNLTKRRACNGCYRASRGGPSCTGQRKTQPHMDHRCFSQAAEAVLKCGYGSPDEHSHGETTDPGRDSADCRGVCSEWHESRDRCFSHLGNCRNSGFRTFATIADSQATLKYLMPS